MYVSEPLKLFVIYIPVQAANARCCTAVPSAARHQPAAQQHIGSAGQLDSLTTRDQDLRSVYIYTKAKRSEGIT